MGGGDKLLEPVNRIPILRRQAARACTLGPTYVTLPAPDHPRAAAVPDDAQVVYVQGHMSDSIRAGIAALPETATGVIILPADMPDITAQDMGEVKQAALETGAPVVRASTADGRPGHPIYFARRTFAGFAALSGDRGAFRLCNDWVADTVLVPLAGDRARLDLDTPEDWAAYRAR